MRFACNSFEINAAISKIQGSVKTDAAIPALKGILVVAGEGKVTFTAYNLETGIKTTIKAEVDEPGEIVLEAHRLNDIVKSLPSNRVLFMIRDNKCTIKSGDACYNILGNSSEEYPELPTVDDGKKIIFSRQLLKSMIRQVRFAVSKDENNVVAQGILFDIKDGKFNLVSLDGFRLAVRTENAHSNSEDMKFIVPAKSLLELIKIYGDEPGEINISVGKRHIMFEIDEYMMISRLTEGEFMDYSSIIPNKEGTKVRVETKKMIECIERISLIIDDRISYPLRMVIDEGTIKFSTTTSIGNAEDKVEASIEGERIEIGFNSGYLLEALKSTECEEILMEYTGSLSAVKIVPVLGEEFIFLVLPVRLPM